MSFGQMRPKWKCLAIIQGATFGKTQTQHISTNTSYQPEVTVMP